MTGKCAVQQIFETEGFTSPPVDVILTTILRDRSIGNRIGCNFQAPAASFCPRFRIRAKAGRDKNQNEMLGLQGEILRAFVRFRFKPASTRRP